METTFQTIMVAPKPVFPPPFPNHPNVNRDLFNIVTDHLSFNSLISANQVCKGWQNRIDLRKRTFPDIVYQIFGNSLGTAAVRKNLI